MNTRLIKRSFYVGFRNIVDNTRSFISVKLSTLSFKLGKKIKDTYSLDERFDKYRRAMDAIEAIAPKNDYCYTENNHELYTEDECDDYDYGIGFNYLDDDEYDMVNGIQQDQEPNHKIEEMREQITNILAMLSCQKEYFAQDMNERKEN